MRDINKILNASNSIQLTADQILVACPDVAEQTESGIVLPDGSQKTGLDSDTYYDVEFERIIREGVVVLKHNETREHVADHMIPERMDLAFLAEGTIRMLLMRNNVAFIKDLGVEGVLGLVFPCNWISFFIRQSDWAKNQLDDLEEKLCG